MIKAILLDMGNVIVDFSPYYIVSNYTSNKEDLNFLVEEIFLKSEWTKLDHGSITEEELIIEVKKRLPKRLHKTLVDIINTWDHHFVNRDDSLKLIKELKAKGYKLILASNAGLRFDQFKSRIKALSYLDDLIISAKIKLSKPDPKFFKYILKKHSLKAKECLFIDDLFKNVLAATNLGINGFVYNGNIKVLRAYLKNIKVL